MLLGSLFYHASYIHVGAYPLFVEIASFSLVCMVSLDFDDGCIGYNPIAMTHWWYALVITQLPWLFDEVITR